MKIRTWLLLAFLVVMLLPLLFTYGLYLLINAYDQKQSLLEYLEMMGQMEGVERVLSEPFLYQVQAQQYYEEKLAEFRLASVVIYNQDGVVLHAGGTETRMLPAVLTRQPASTLYKNLYQLQTNHRSYTLKKPYIHQGNLLGFYQITLLREDWLEGVGWRSKGMIVGLIAFFLLLYGIVWWVLQRKLVRPLSKLMGQMTAFARNEAKEPLEHHSKDEIGELINHFQRMAQEIQEAQDKLQAEQQARQLMIASLGHDLKTPLTSIRAFAEVLSLNKNIAEQEREEYLQIMLEKTDLMKRIVDDLTTFTLLQSADYQLPLVEVEGEEFFEMLFSGYEELAEREDIHLSMEIAVQEMYKLNTTQMMRLMDNLMSNALRYTPVGKRIYLAALASTQANPQWFLPPFRKELEQFRSDTLLIVQNEGPGIATGDQEKVFQPFFQGEASRKQQQTKSSGLGLSIAKMIMEKHQGKIYLYSAPELGTAVVCALPEQKEQVFN